MTTSNSIQVLEPLNCILKQLYDLDKATFTQRLIKKNPREELLVKAIGKGRYPNILDATAGLSRDGFLMATVCNKLVLLERHPDVYKSLNDLFHQMKDTPLISELLDKMQLLHCCAIDYLNSKNAPVFDVIYCDPMFPTKTKSALPKKESQYLQSIVGHDKDAELLVATALAKAKHRVVVKRPLRAPALIKSPSVQFTARAHRFDVYCII